MQCKCGSETRLSEAVKGKLKARLEFQVCKGCGRVSSGELFVRELSVAQDGAGSTARALFDGLDDGEAERLYEEAVATQRAPDVAAEVMEPEQAELF